MLLKSKQLAYAGVMMALAVILIVLSGVIEMNSLFLLAIAACLVGFVQRDLGLKKAIVFWAGTTILGFLLAPQKLYCFTFLAFAAYIVLEEYVFQKQCTADDTKKMPVWKEWLLKGIWYHFIIIVFLMSAKAILPVEQIFKSGFLERFSDRPVILGILLIAGAEVLWVVFDRAYLGIANQFQYLKNKVNM